MPRQMVIKTFFCQKITRLQATGRRVCRAGVRTVVRFIEVEVLAGFVVDGVPTFHQRYLILIDWGYIYSYLPGHGTDILQYRLRFVSSLLYKSVFHLNRLTAQLSYEGRAAVEGGK
jgi:hypothetical protein